MASCREDGGVISEVSTRDDSESSFIELRCCENLPKDNNDRYNGQTENKMNVGCIRKLDEINSSSDDSVDDVFDVFGNDWIGKPGVSTSSESEDLPQNSTTTESKKKRIRGRSMPSNITVVEGEPVRYRCTICVKTFNSKGHIRYHAYCGQSEKPFKCSLCSKSFSKKTVLDYHIKTHTGERPFICLMCDKSFLQLDKLKRHKRIHFGNKIECDKCHEKFRDLHSLNVHKRTHSQRNLYVFKCDSCTKSFKDKSTLNKHIKGVHSISKQFFCEHCGKGFDWKYNLVCHIRTHSGVRAYACSECTRTFKNQNDCNKHRLTHTDEREYKCNVCDGTFKRRDNLIRHLRNIHPEKQPSKIMKIPKASCASTSSNTQNPPHHSTKYISSKVSNSSGEGKGGVARKVISDSTRILCDRIQNESCDIANEPRRNTNHSNIIMNSYEANKTNDPRIPKNSNIIFKESNRNPESDRLRTNLSMIPGLSSISSDMGRNPSSNIIFIESSKHPGYSEEIINYPRRIANNSSVMLNVSRQWENSENISDKFRRLPSESRGIPSESHRTSNPLVLGESNRFPKDLNSFPNNLCRTQNEFNGIPINSNMIFSDACRNPGEPVQIPYNPNSIFGESSRLSVDPEFIPLDSDANGNDTNRISVIRNFTSPQPTNAVQSSVIKHSGNASSPRARSLTPPLNFRECVIKSTKQ